MIKFKLNDKLLTVSKDTTIFEAAKQHGILIPNLCHQDHLTSNQSCNLCVVHIKGKSDLVLSCTTKVASNMEVTTKSKQITKHVKTALEKILRDHYADCDAPCQVACPDHVDIQSYLYHISKGNHQEAVRVIRQRLPMPMSVGRICPAFCEQECRRSLVEDPVAIRQLKRHAADKVLMETPIDPPIKAPAKNKKVAIVGGGPSGLTCGYYLSLKGYEAQVFEAAPLPGGWLRYGIPQFRLPKEVLDKEIEQMCQNGMSISTNVEIGQEIGLADLSHEYDAVYLAIGASLAVPIMIKGQNLNGVLLGVDFLKAHALGKNPQVNKQVIVVGGGNTAIDCARVAIRLGSEVTVVYRRTEHEMPAEAYEVEAARQEGVKFSFLTNPVELKGDKHSKLKKVKLEKMTQGKPDESGRRRPMPSGEFFEQSAQTLIAAISQTPDTKMFDQDFPLTKWNTADVNDFTMHVKDTNIFAGGDFKRGAASAIEAVADGRIAADMIDSFIQKKPLMSYTPFDAKKELKVKDVSVKEYQHFEVNSRTNNPELPPKIRRKSFEEVERPRAEENATSEAARCLECGCAVNTNCDLRDYATEYSVDNSTFFSKLRHKATIDNSSPFLNHDSNRCIHCGLCVSACNDQLVNEVLSFKDKNTQEQIIFDNGLLVKDSSCVQCGGCVQVCPVGALTASNDKSHGRLWPPKVVETVCPYCGVGCKLDLHINPINDSIVSVNGNQKAITNQGMLCVKGRHGFDFVGSKQRLTHPLIKENGRFVKASWDEALNIVAKKFMKVKKDHGPDAFAGLCSAKVTNEDNFVFQKFVRKDMQTNNVDHCARLCHASTVVGLAQAFGSGAMTNDISGIHKADVILIIGSDTSAAHPVIAARIKKAVRANKTKLIVIDPKEIDIASYATIYAAQLPGTDVAVLNSIMQEIIRLGLEDKDYLKKRTEGLKEFMKVVMADSYRPENVEKVSKVPAKKLSAIAKLMGNAKVASVFYAMGITQHTTGSDNVRSIANLQMLLGNVGKVGGGVNPLRGQSNVQGACDMGGLPGDYPGYQKVASDEVRSKFEHYWKTSLPKKPGLTVVEMFNDAYDKQIKAMYIMGENPYLSDPDQTHVIEALKRLDFLVVQDIFLTETAAFADVVLPAQSFAERDGHITNTERRVQRQQKAVKAPGESMPDWEIVQAIANKMCANYWNYAQTKDITKEINDLTPQYKGITWDRITKLKDGLQWPCPDTNHPGTKILHVDKFARGKGKMMPIKYNPPAETADPEYPLTLTTGRLLAQYHTGTMTRKTSGLNELGKPHVMISVADAVKLGITNQQIVKVSSKRGEIEIPAFVTKKIQVGVIYIPFHFVESPANRLTNPALDPDAKIPEFKVCAAKVELIESVSMLDDVKKELLKSANQKKAQELMRFFKTGPGEYGEGDKFLGIKVPDIRKVARKYKKISIEDATALLRSSFHEERMCALFILINKYQDKKVTKSQQEQIYKIYIKNVKYINNWDLVDVTAHHIVGDYLFKKDKSLLYEFANSDDLWKKRIAILSTFYFIKQLHFDDSLKIAKILLTDDHDLIHKGVGWMLREIGNRHIKTEENFLKKHYKKMPRTMLRYAIEKFPEKKRKEYLLGKI
ncbi:MAG: formate dehydrogenase subunit alpha [Bacteriovoracaceae bacterium]|nr:formate dehydrogenase subunit alpha [Bacteriovoracaceae bacterium]